MDQALLAQKMEELKKDSVFAEKIRNAESLEEFQRLFAEEGIELDKDSMQAFRFLPEEEGELEEQDLENIAGGFRIGFIEFKFTKPKWWPW